MERPFLSSKVYISFWTTSVVSPTERTNSSVCSKVGVRISPKPCRPAMRISVSSIYRIRALFSGIKSCVPRGALVISAIVIPTSLPHGFIRRFWYEKTPPLPFPVLPENARDGENSVVPPLLSRLQNALPAPLKNPLNAGKSGGLRPGTRLPADWVSFFPGQFAAPLSAAAGPSLVRSPEILLPC